MNDLEIVVFDNPVTIVASLRSSLAFLASSFYDTVGRERVGHEYETDSKESTDKNKFYFH